MWRHLPRLILLFLYLLAACSSGGDDAAATTTTLDIEATTTTAPPIETTTSTGPPPRLPAMNGDGRPRVLVTPTGVVAPVVGGRAGAWQVTTPCGKRATVAVGTTVSGATVVLDPGHGGTETGSSSPDGSLIERDLNLVVANLTKAALEREGATVVLTRQADYRIPLEGRAAIAHALKPPVFVSIHHNGGHDGPADRPGTEMYYQYTSPASKRLAGILYEEMFDAFDDHQGITWNANVDAGAKYRLSDSGGDYYGILRRTAGITAVLSEALFLSASQSEADLLARPDVQQAEAEAITRAIRRFMLGDDQGSGFVAPIPRTTPAGPGGGGSGCVDPPLG